MVGRTVHLNACPGNRAVGRRPQEGKQRELSGEQPELGIHGPVLGKRGPCFWEPQGYIALPFPSVRAQLLHNFCDFPIGMLH